MPIPDTKGEGPGTVVASNLNPQTLTGDRPQIPKTKDEAKRQAQQAGQRWVEMQAEAARNGLYIDVEDGEVKVKIKNPVFEKMSPEQRAQAKALGIVDEYIWVGAVEAGFPELQEAYTNKELAEELVKYLGDTEGAGATYLDLEKAKTKEVERQYEDFKDRASLLYDLMDKEQQYAMNADDQNYENLKRQKELGMASPFGYYATPYYSMTLSRVLSPSLPDYVLPDYRLNQSVGLPGPQGFDDPDYPWLQAPAYAFGTKPGLGWYRPTRVPWPWGGRR